MESLGVHVENDVLARKLLFPTGDGIKFLESNIASGGATGNATSEPL